MVFRFKGCFTALITPFDSSTQINWESVKSLTEFQNEGGVAGIVPAGTTGESPTLNWEEHNQLIETVFESANSHLTTIAGTGSNSTEEALAATKYAADHGLTAALLVDPYYNGPSSIEIRREYYEPIAEEVSGVQLIPYIIPGRTGTQLLPQDLAFLSSRFENISAVKEATGSLDNARQIRDGCGESFTILSGDDDKTLQLMRDPSIGSSGVISVMSNIVPNAVRQMVDAALSDNWVEADRLGSAMQPLFELVTVKVNEGSSRGVVSVKARNPLPVKTMMRILGMQNGPCRRPLGRMTHSGVKIILDNLKKIWKNNPELLEPIGRFFDVSIEERLQSRDIEGLIYDSY